MVVLINSNRGSSNSTTVIILELLLVLELVLVLVLVLVLATSTSTSTSTSTQLNTEPDPFQEIWHKPSLSLTTGPTTLCRSAEGTPKQCVVSIKSFGFSHTWVAVDLTMEGRLRAP